MKNLLAVPGIRDPYRAGPIAGMDECGPVLAAVSGLAAETVFLADLPGCEPRTDAVAAALRERHSGLTLHRVPLPLAVPEDLGAAWAAVTRLLTEISRIAPGIAEMGIVLPEDDAAVSLALLHAGAGTSMRIRFFRVRPPWLSGGFEAHVLEVSNPWTHARSHSPRRLRESKATYRVERPPPPASEPVPEPASKPRRRRKKLFHTARELGVVAGHPSMRRILATAESVAPHSVPVLIQGETGTGKGLIARLLHALGTTPEGPFVSVNCGALPDALVESQLFGHRRGAFTGAVADYEGLIARAHGGTLFLDEIGELPLHLQPKLLKVLEDGEVEPIGASGGTPVQARILSATNRDLRAAVARREFREDLYYRLAFAVVELPPLRNRRSDIPPLALQMLDRINQSIKIPRQLSRGALAALKRGNWSGNVRDLENLIGRSVLLAPGEVIEALDLVWEDDQDEPPPRHKRAPPFGHGFKLERHLAAERERTILRALKQTDGNRTEAARLLGVSRQSVTKFLQQRARKANATR